MITSQMVRIGAIGTAIPPCVISQKDAFNLIEQYYNDELHSRSMELLRQFFRHDSIHTRAVAVDSRLGLVGLKDEDPDVRVVRFTKWSVELSAQACERAVEKAGIHLDDVDAIIVNTCTGYICPGISTYLIERLGLDKSVRLFDLVGAGCGGAMPNLQLGESLVKEKPGTIVLCVSVEICSATYQMADDPSLLISNAIFGDGAAAALLWDRPSGIALQAKAQKFAPQYRDDIRYVHRNGQLHNKLTGELPSIIAQEVPHFLRKLLETQGKEIQDVKAWALHPGGDRIISALRRELGLSDDGVRWTRGIFKTHGNMSSPTVLFILNEILESGILNPGDLCMISSYGAGLSMHAYLLQR